MSESTESRGLYELLATQRAIRRLRADSIPGEVIRRIMQAAAWAPSGGNAQPWRMIWVEDASRKAALGALYGSCWRAFAGHYKERIAGLPEAERAKQERTLRAGDYLGDHFGECPGVFVVCFQPAMLAVTDAKQDRVSVVGGGSIYPAVQNLLLACRAEGVGAVLTTLLCQVEPDVTALLGIPDGWATAAAIPIGYPVGGGYGPTTRLPIQQLFFKDGWGAPVD